MSAKGQRIGYVRVSSYEQNPERQLEHLDADRIFTDKASGKDVERPELQALLQYAREGDTIVVHSMDRVPRQNQIRLKQLTFSGVDLHARGHVDTAWFAASSSRFAR